MISSCDQTDTLIYRRKKKNKLKIQTLLIEHWSSVGTSLCVLEYAEGFNVESADAPHEGLLHGLLVALPLDSQSLHLHVGFLDGFAMLKRQRGLGLGLSL